MSIGISLSIYFNKPINSNERLVLSMGLSFIALVMFANLTKGQSSTVNEEYIFPIYTASSEDCDIVLEFNTMSFTRKALQVTMTTNYNETYNSVLDEIPFIKPFKQYLSLNASKVFTLTTNDTTTLFLRHKEGDVLQLFNTEALGTKYAVSIEKYSFITIYGTGEATNVTIVAVDNSLNNTYKLDFGETVSFSPVISGIYHVEGSGKIGIIYSNRDLTYMCDNTVNIVWEMIPPLEYAGSEFMLYIPDVESAYLEVLGYQDSQLTLHISEDVTSILLKGFERKIINITQARYVHLTSSSPVTVMCIVNLTIGIDDNTVSNMLNVFPVEKIAGCSYFTAFNCANTTCGYFVTRNTTEDFVILDKEGAVIRRFNSSQKQTNGVVSGWDISNISDGIYVLQSERTNVPLAVFYVDVDNGRYYQNVITDNTTTCDITSIPISTDIADEANLTNNTFTSNETSVPNVLLFNSTINSSDITSTGAYSDNNTISTHVVAVNQSAQSVPKKGLLSYLASNTTTGNGTDVVEQSINNRLIFPFMYEEIPDDDSVLNEYLIAVIVSLCTAIFAVIAVISTFLLLELLRRRRQIRNTKIRPFVT